MVLCSISFVKIRSSCRWNHVLKVIWYDIEVCDCDMWIAVWLQFAWVGNVCRWRIWSFWWNCYCGPLRKWWLEPLKKSSRPLLTKVILFRNYHMVTKYYWEFVRFSTTTNFCTKTFAFLVLKQRSVTINLAFNYN